LQNNVLIGISFDNQGEFALADQKRIPINLRALLILEIIGQNDQAMTAPQVVDKIGLPRQTVHRLMVTLEQEGFLIKTGNRYRPARRLRQLGAGLLHASSLHIERHQILRSVSDAAKETVNYVVPQEGGMHYLDRYEADWVFQVQLPRGSNVPFHCTASGKTYMSSLKKSDRERFVGALDLKRLTKNTITDPDHLLRELEAIRRNGHAEDREEFVEDMMAFAVPLTDAHGRFLAALATHGPKFRMNTQDPTVYIDALKEGARKLQAIL
jgi:DNA-binding IclR family transcriptional regulator